ncbi:MAG TPA: hypothetical protein VFO70_09035 [Chitinophagaceae bacterium]|nr:hypothetical protein [Chitinophagaceae bacterium]
MPDLFYFISKWWRKVTGVVIFSVLVTGIIVFVQPRKYLSETTALRASPLNTDKASIFNKNIESLYSTFGSADELDMIVGTGQLDTIYLAMTDQFNLVTHYNLKGKKIDLLRSQASRLLKQNSRVTKTGFGELNIMVWDMDKYFAANMANAMMDLLQDIHRQLLSESNNSTLNGLRGGQLRLQHELDSIDNILENTPEGTSREMASIRKDLLMNKWYQYEELIGEYQLVVDTKQPALLVVEKARPGAKPDKPKRLPILISTAVLSFIFAVLAALVLERIKPSRS